MVDFQKWVSIVFEVAPRGADATEIMSFAARLWNQNKEGIKAATVSEARDFAKRKV